MTAMSTIRLRIIAFLVLTILVTAGSVLIPRGTSADVAPAPELPKVPKEMLEKRLETVKKVWKEKWKVMTSGLSPQPDLLFGWSERLLDVELPLLDKPKDRIAALQAHVDRTREVERIVSTYAKRGVGRTSDADAATYERINAEIRFFQASGKAP